MLLLSDIELSRDCILSMQDPYTLNGELITSIDLDINYTNFIFNSIYITNQLDYRVCFPFETLKNLFNRHINQFIAQHGENPIIGENGYVSSINLREYNVDKYLNNIRQQCANFDVSLLKNRLRAQGRLVETGNTVNLSNSENITDTTATASTTTINYNSTSYRFSDEILNGFNIGRLYFSEPFVSSKKYVHPYNYKPEYIKHYMPGEDESTLLLGAEIEVAGNTKQLDKEEVVKKCIQIMNGSDDDIENLIYSTSDSTVQIELDTMPCTLEFHKQMNYKEMFKYLDELGYKGHDCDNAGLHIHANRSYLGKTKLMQQLTISKILYILEKFNDQICVIARRNNEYSKFVGKAEVNESLDVLYNKYKNIGKKVALNLQHPDTIEFRMFRSTLKCKTFLLTLEFVQDIINYAKKINIEEIELIKWNDLMATFSDELKEYYNDRKKKEKEKAKKGIKYAKDAFDTLGTISSVTVNSIDTLDRTIRASPSDTITAMGSLTNRDLNSLDSLVSSYATCNGALYPVYDGVYCTSNGELYWNNN